MKTTDYAIVLILIVASMVLSPLVNNSLKLFGRDASQAPTIIALDINSFTMAAMEQGSEDAISEAIANINEAADRLAKEGYIVVKRDAVLAAPEEYIITANQGKY